MRIELLLAQAQRRIGQRLEQLDARVAAGDEAACREYVEAAGVLVRLYEQLHAGKADAMLTTAQMAERLGVSAKTLLRHKRAGKIQPAVIAGKFLRWTGGEKIA